MDFDTFFAAWSLALLIDFKTCLRQLHYLGVDVKSDKACILTTNDARSRRIIRGFVFGGKGVGKVTIKWMI